MTIIMAPEARVTTRCRGPGLYTGIEPHGDVPPRLAPHAL